MENDNEIKPLYLKELAGLYGITTKTMRKWIRNKKEIGEPIGYQYSIRQVELVFYFYGVPSKYK